ncbi:MAG: hypothetical protein SNH79_02650 [Rikenellaceae bacterium]
MKKTIICCVASAIVAGALVFALTCFCCGPKPRGGRCGERKEQCDVRGGAARGERPERGERPDRRDSMSNEQIAKMMTERMTKQLSLTEAQATKVYALNLSQVQSRKATAERAQSEYASSLRKVLSAEQIAKLEENKPRQGAKPAPRQGAKPAPRQGAKPQGGKQPKGDAGCAAKK